jgi:ribonuclease HI
MSVKELQEAAAVSEVVIAATDGSANPNSGPGGWVVIMIGDGKYTKLAG